MWKEYRGHTFIITARAELAKALKNVDPQVRANAANALRVLDDPRATMPLIDALNDEDERVRRTVARALSDVADNRALESFNNMLRDRNDSVRFWAIFWLQRIGDTSSVDALIKSLGDPYERVRGESVVALGPIGDVRAIEPIKKLLADEDEYNRLHAREVLQEKFNVPVKSDYEAVTKLLEDYNIEQKRDAERMKQVLDEIIALEKTKGKAQTSDLFWILYERYRLDESEAYSILNQLSKLGVITYPTGDIVEICA